MYRIEVASGEETVFRTIEELAVAIRNGVVTPRSRIYHNASQKWLPIGLHPHYKKAMELPAGSAAHPTPPTPLPGKPQIRAQPKPKIPTPVVSPVVAMQQEVLRDLPVVALPDPLPWTPRPAAAVAPEPPPPAPAQVTFGLAAPAVLVEPEVKQVPAQAARRHEEAFPEEHGHERPTARRAPRAGGRPLLLLGTAAAIAVGAYFALAARSPAPASASEHAAPADASAEYFEEPLEEEAPNLQGAAAGATSPPARVSSAPARVPMTPGPAFAASVPARPGSDAAAARGPAPAPAPAAIAPGVSSIEPAPVELEMALPDLRADSVVPVARTGDSLAMKRILRALNGSKPEEAAAP